MKLLKSASPIGLAIIFLLSSQFGAHAKDQEQAIWSKIALVPFTIAPQTLEGAPIRPNQETVAQKLAQEATTRAERLLRLRHVGGEVERVTSLQNATAPVIVTGSVSLPLSLPPGVIGWKARARKGAFVTAKTVLLDATGKVLAQEEVTLDWGEVGWLSGARAKRNVPLDEVLRKFTRKSVDQAIEHLQQKKNTRRQQTVTI